MVHATGAGFAVRGFVWLKAALVDVLLLLVRWQGRIGLADLAVDLRSRLLLHGVGHMGVDVQGSEYQISSHIGPSRYFFSGGGVLSISL